MGIFRVALFGTPEEQDLIEQTKAAVAPGRRDGVCDTLRTRQSTKFSILSQRTEYLGKQKKIFSVLISETLKCSPTETVISRRR